MNAKIVRLAGDDRCSTSIEIAKHMADGTSVGTAYVVGADGEADAMSIAAYAAQNTSDATATAGQKISPIIVTPAKGLTLEAKYFLDANDVTTGVVVGGEAKVSTDVLKDIKEVTKQSSVKRIAGNTRHETNANVIKEYYSATSVSTVFVAKDGYAEGNGKLIDALAVAPMAGRTTAPIVLATDDLTSSQASKLAATVKNDGTGKAYQIGKGISSTIMSKVVKMLGLDK